MSDFLPRIAAQIETWSGIAIPNDAARRMAESLAAVIQAFEEQRGKLTFEDEPASFEAALQETKE